MISKKTGHLRQISVVVFICISWIVNNKKRCQGIILFKYYQKKPSCFDLESDSKKNPKKITSKRKRVSEFIIDETAIKVGSELIWLWVTIYQLA